MPGTQAIFEVALAGFALSLSPGPSMLYIFSRTIGQGRVAGIASAIGLCAGGIILAIVAALGLGILVEQNTLLVRATSILGAIYLIYLGWRQVSDAKTEFDDAQTQIKPCSRSRPIRIFGQAIMVEALNPKTILFFALFIAPFLDPSAGDLKLQAIILGLLVPLTAIPSDLVVVLFGGEMYKFALSHSGLRLALAWIACLILVFIGINLLWEILH